jgi:hypothetical protein
LLIADCSLGCQQRYEWLVPVGLVVLGLALAVVGVLLLMGRIATPSTAGGRQAGGSRNL